MHVSRNTQTPHPLHQKHPPCRRGKEASSCAQNARKDRTQQKTECPQNKDVSQAAGRRPENLQEILLLWFFVALLPHDCAVTNPVVVWQAPNRSKRGHRMVFVVHEPDKQQRETTCRGVTVVVVIRGDTGSGQADGEGRPYSRACGLLLAHGGHR